MGRKTKHRKDGNQDDLVKLIRNHGASWLNTSQNPISGSLDGLIGWYGVDQRVEIKDPIQPTSKRKLTPAEKETFDLWKGRKPVIIETPSDVILLLRSMQTDALR